ncbi:MAG TPA: hypothetical protein VGH03_10380 [Caulobacteraceae bacterium]
MAPALPGFVLAGLALGFVGTAHAAPQPPRPIYDCARGDPADKTICRSPNLKRTLHMIDAHYAVAVTFGDPDVRFLAGWDRFYFAARLWACDGLASVSEAAVGSCVREEVSRKAEAMSGGVTREGLLQGLIRGGSLNAFIVQRYPTTFLDRIVTVCARTRLHSAMGGALVGHAEDCRSGGAYEVRIDHPAHNDRTLLAGKTEATAWMTGRFELHRGALEFQCRPGSVTPAGPADAFGTEH